jgi:hypothetical protein
MTATPTRPSKSPSTSLSKPQKMSAVPREPGGALTAAGKKALASVKRGAQGAARVSATFAKTHPIATATALAGVALAVGAATQRALHREPTFGEVLKKTVARQARGISQAMAAKTRQGVGAAARSLNQKLK